MQGIGKEKAREALIEHKTHENFIAYLGRLKLRIGANKFETKREKIIEEFRNAIKAFTYQQVYDPDSRTCKRLSHIFYEGLRVDEDMILGPVLRDESVHDIARGIRTSEIKESDILKVNKKEEPGSKRRNAFITNYMPHYGKKPKSR